MDRALREFRIRGVSAPTSPLSINLLKHPTFLSNEYTTKFIDETPDLFDFKKPPRPRHQGPDLYRGHHRERAPRNQGPPRTAPI